MTEELELVRKDLRNYDDKIVNKVDMQEAARIWDNFKKFA